MSEMTDEERQDLLAHSAAVAEAQAPRIRRAEDILREAGLRIHTQGPTIYVHHQSGECSIVGFSETSISVSVHFSAAGELLPSVEMILAEERHHED